MKRRTFLAALGALAVVPTFVRDFGLPVAGPRRIMGGMGQYVTGDLENLDDLIYRISPHDTPFMTRAQTVHWSIHDNPENWHG